MERLRILVVDDEKNICRSMKLILSSEGYIVDLAENAKEAMDIIAGNKPDIMFLDVLLPDKDGISLLSQIKRNYPSIEVIMISGHANLTMAVKATREGAYDFLEKPLQKEKILLTLEHLVEKKRLVNKYESLAQERLDDFQMIGDSSVWQIVKRQIQQVAPTESKVLIMGESGTGKELVAWSIHQQSSRKEHSFVKMNCAAIPEELTESELFGYEKGAFTGAHETRDGKFLQADGGTLFLDEIADMSLKAQTKVLRVLQDGQFERIGGKSTLTVDVRVIAATNKSLEKMVESGQFRQDLYYRLNVFPIILPPLRNRKQDIPLLANHFVRKYCIKANRKPVRISTDVQTILNTYHWPGNIRELQNIIERLLILTSRDEILIKDIPSNLFQSSAEIPYNNFNIKSLKEVREEAERDYIVRCLERCKGNVSEAARIMNIERTNLHKKMKTLGIK